MSTEALLTNDYPKGKSMDRFDYAGYTATYETIPDDDSHIADLLKEMKQNFKLGKTKDIEFRLGQLKSLQTAILNNLDALKQSIMKDLGRRELQAHMECNGIVHTITNIMKNLKKWAQDVPCETPLPVGPGHSYIKWEPLGVICVMGAWNFPFTTLIGPALEVIAAGNCCVFKPSELAPSHSKVFAKIVAEGLDQRFYRVCEGKSKVAVTLNQQPFDMFVFTGSTQKGKLVASAAAKNLVPCVLELGGKSPTVVDDTANLSWAAKKILLGKMFNTGQICIAPDYVLCHESKVKGLVDEMRKHLKEGYNNNNEDQMGKIINEFHYKRLCSLFADHGGEVVLGNPNAHQDFNLQPSVILSPKTDSKLMTEEIFGPILPVIVYKEFNEAIEFITSRDKPLAAYYFGDINSKNFKTFESEVSTGAINTNDVVMQVANEHLPFGGVGPSGYGRFHGETGFRQFSNGKSCLVKGVADYFPFNGALPPMTAEKEKQLMGYMKKPPPTMSQVKKGICGFVMTIVVIILLIIFRGEIMGLFSDTKSSQE